MAAINLYAELLLNIRQVTVFVTLPTGSNDRTQFELSTDRKVLYVYHDGEQNMLNLPCQTISTATIQVPTSSFKELSFRLQAALEDRDSQMNELDSEQTSIWPASQLTPQTQIACRSCKDILAKDSINVWKDLPSENWAEMMDFWHCHKPRVKEDTRYTDVSKKGYSASNCCTPRPSIGYVNDLHLRLSSSDCSGMQVSYYAQLRR